MMDSRLIDTLRNAPSLDLYELNLMVNQLLADPIRILEIRRHLHLGAPVMFFDHRTNALTRGRVTEFRQKDVCIQEDGVHLRQWHNALCRYRRRIDRAHRAVFSAAASPGEPHRLQYRRHSDLHRQISQGARWYGHPFERQDRVGLV
jgi:hypothetical protein